jgi:hypothetical protein
LLVAALAPALAEEGEHHQCAAQPEGSPRSSPSWLPRGPAAPPARRLRCTVAARRFEAMSRRPAQRRKPSGKVSGGMINTQIHIKEEGVQWLTW